MKMMAEIGELLNIPRIAESTKFWMIRTKRGFFFDEFIQKGFVAIGWNLIVRSMISDRLTKSQVMILKRMIKENYDESRPGTALNKCIRFCYEIKSGDIAVIVDNRRIAFAVIGEYFEEAGSEPAVRLEKEIHESIERNGPNSDAFSCPYIKRRKITLIKVLSDEDVVSPYLLSAMARNWHSLSDMNEYGEIILSGCYDAFVYKNKLTLTFRVMQKEDIVVLDLANFVLSAAQILSDGHAEKVKVKTTLHSPGDIILQVADFVQKNALPILVCYVAIFGGKVKDYELHSLIGIIKDLINSNYEKKKRALELRKLTAETELAEQEAISRALANLEKQHSLQNAMVDTHVKPVIEASEKLQIAPGKATIIDMTKILENYPGKREDP